MELENWITWKRMTGPDRSDAVDFRHELEYGVTDKLEVSVYLAEWFYENQREHSRFAYSDSTIELISNLTKPVDDPIGLSIYGEIKADDRLIEVESKLIAQKNLGPLILAYNATLEAVWEGQSLQEREGEFTLREGRSLFISRCIECHTLPMASRFTESDWPCIVHEMGGRAKLKPAERNAVLAYILAVHSQLR